MLEPVLDSLGDINPQLFREIKGKLRPRNIIITVLISVIVQFFFFITSGVIFHPQGSTNLFMSMSVWAIFILIVAGTYMIINDLTLEEKRGTLYFVRLSPTTAKNIILGKIIGVPFLLFLGVILALPLHLWASWSAKVNFDVVACFYITMAGSCLFFYSFAVLLSLISYQVQSLKAWGGALLALLWLTLAMTKPIINGPLDWINLYSPSLVLQYIDYGNNFYLEKLNGLEMFYLPIGKSIIFFTLLLLVNLAIATQVNFWAIERRFYHHQAPLFSKKQSYQQTLFNAILLVGLAAQNNQILPKQNGLFNFNFYTLLVISLIIFVFLVYSLIPQQETLQTWARYHHIENRDLIKDLIWGERSPATVAIAINLLILFVVIGLWSLSWGNPIKTVQGLIGLLMSIIIMVIYTIMAEISVLLYTPLGRKKQQTENQISLLTIIGLVLIPLIVLGTFHITPEKAPFLWMFSFIPWVAIHYSSPLIIGLGFLAQIITLGLCSSSLKDTIIKVGESETKRIDERIREL